MFRPFFFHFVRRNSFLAFARSAGCAGAQSICQYAVCVSSINQLFKCMAHKWCACHGGCIQIFPQRRAHGSDCHGAWMGARTWASMCVCMCVCCVGDSPAKGYAHIITRNWTISNCNYIHARVVSREPCQECYVICVLPLFLFFLMFTRVHHNWRRVHIIYLHINSTNGTTGTLGL